MLGRWTLLLLVVACGGKTVDALDEGGANDGGAKNDAVVVPTDAFPLPDSTLVQCNTLDPGSKTISLQEVPQDAPPFASTSEPLQPGLYELGSLVLYTGPNGASGTAGTIASHLRVNVANSADYILQVSSVQNQTPTTTNANANDAGAGMLEITATCPNGGTPMKVLYTANASSFTVRVTNNSDTTDETFDLIGQ